VVTKTSDPSVNQVHLVGRVSRDPGRRELPSGDGVVFFRLVVARQEAAYRGRQRIDVLDCVAWGGRPMRTVAGWRAGDVVEVDGSLRRRFFRVGGSTSSRVEIEVRTARLIRRASSG
jgi:single-strand DNA-binding protein